MKMTRESGILLLVSAFIGAFGAALLSAGVGLNFATVALVGIIFLYILEHGQDANIVWGLVGIVIGVLIQLVSPAKAPGDSQVLLAGLCVILTLKA